MKKLLALLLTLALVLPCFAIAEEEVPSILDMDPEELLVFDRDADVLSWVGNWVAVAAFIGEEYADDNDIEINGLISVPENAVMVSVEALLDASATGSPDGVMVDQGNYWHAHVYDAQLAVTFAEDIDDGSATLYVPWDGWLAEATGDGEGTFNKGVAKLSKVSASDKSLYFTAVTGVESDEIDDEKVKYVGITTGGYLVICYCDENLVNKNVEVSFGYIFKLVEE